MIDKEIKNHCMPHGDLLKLHIASFCCLMHFKRNHFYFG